MKILFVFDCCTETGNIDKLNLNEGDTVYLFPLISKVSEIAVLLNNIKSRGCQSETIQTAKNINLAADNLRNRYIKFIADMPNLVRHRDKNLKELFAIDKYATLWWFSLISEKNTYKSDAFNRLVQLDQ